MLIRECVGAWLLVVACAPTASDASAPRQAPVPVELPAPPPDPTPTTQLPSDRDPTPSPECAEKYGCFRFGDCVRVGDTCLAVANENCTDHSEACRVFGRCAVRDGHCVAVLASDCEASEQCQAHGLCALHESLCAGSGPDGTVMD